MFGWFKKKDLAVFHEFMPPPTGGGHQFMRALVREMKNQGMMLSLNRLPKKTRACLFNSFNFNFTKLRRQVHPDCCMVQRVDGPLKVYRGFDDGTDDQIYTINQELAEVTVFQSHFSLKAHQELGYAFKRPVIIPNTPDPEIFHAEGRSSFEPGRPIRVVATSWSDNENKGLDVFQWLDQHLNTERFEFTFFGRIKADLVNIRHLPPVNSTELAHHLRQADVFLTASLHDPASNSVMEALACGLPVLYRNSGGHPELVGAAGLGFTEPQQVPGLLDELVKDYTRYQAAIRVPALEDVAEQYLQVLGLKEDI